MSQTDFTDNVYINGSRDITQLTVEGHSTQDEPLQEWKDSAGGTLAQVSGDGRLLIGDDLGMATPDALIEAHRADTSTGKPKRGFHTLGQISGALSDIVNWSVHELELLGNGVVSAVQTALRVRATYDNAATSSSADVRAADVEASIKQGQVNSLTGLRASVTKTSGTVTNAYGVKVEDVSAGGTNYALHTGLGINHLGDTLELKAPGSVPGTPAANEMRVYPKSDGRLYAKNSSGSEYELSAGDPIMSSICNGRLTLSSGIAIPDDVTGATTLYFTPHRGNQVALYDGTRWQARNFTERNLSLSGLDRHRVYDIFLYDNSGTLTLEATGWNAPASGSISTVSNVSPFTITTTAAHGLAVNQVVTIYGVSGATGINGTWRVTTVPTSTTFTVRTLDNVVPSAPGTYTSGGTWVRADQNTSRATALTKQDGIYVRSGALTRRYLGTIGITAAGGQCQDSVTKRLVWNYYHRTERLFEVIETQDSWLPAVANAWAPLSNSLANRVEFVIGVKEDLVVLNHHGFALASSGNSAIFGMGLDNLTSSDALVKIGSSGTTTGSAAFAEYKKPVAEGYHFLQLAEYAFSTTVVTVFGDANLPTFFQMGGVGHLMS